MDHCAFKPVIASRIAAVYTGLGLLVQNNLFLRKFRFRTVRPRGAHQGARLKNTIWLPCCVSPKAFCPITVVFFTNCPKWNSNSAMILTSRPEELKGICWHIFKFQIISNRSNIFSASDGINFASDGCCKDGSIGCFMHGETIFF